MTDSRQKIHQYLDEAHASEVGLVRVLQSQIAMTPRGGYRDAVETHLGETRDHAGRLRARMRALGEGASVLQAGIGIAETIAAQALALGKTPIDLVRGTGTAEKVLKNAKDACATEALEIATYTAIERLADSLGDGDTARLAASIRADEERMLARILEEIPKLAEAVAGAPAAAAREPRPTAGQQPWPGYDGQTAGEITERLAKSDGRRRRAVGTYEQAHKQRATVLAAAEREPAGSAGSAGR